MEKYRLERIRQERVGRVTGIALAAGLHILLAVYGVFTGLKYIYPPPQENSFIIDFTDEEQPKPVHVRNGSQPLAEQIEKTKNIELVQRSEAQHKGTKDNKAPETKVDNFGDVEVKQPVREKEIDRRALFHSADNKTDKDTLAAQTASKISDALKAGHASGNTETGKTQGQPNAKLKGRTQIGILPKPTYAVQESGTVVVTIWVDQYGKVKKALAGAQGTTISDSKLLQATRDAALKAQFNISADAPTLQEGSITYKFNLK
ncbi:MAG: energy transducer TonB family protein [Candidatus Cryptobacteroides sp.]